MKIQGKGFFFSHSIDCKTKASINYGQVFVFRFEVLGEMAKNDQLAHFSPFAGLHFSLFLFGGILLIGPGFKEEGKKIEAKGIA